MRRTPAGLTPIGPPRPASPAPVYAEDFSVVVGDMRRSRRRLRLARGKVKVLS